MKLVILTVILLHSSMLKAVSIDQAPIEWLVVATLSEKLENGALNQDSLVKKIWNQTTYDPETDELHVPPTFKALELREELVTYLEKQKLTSQASADEKYLEWKNEPSSPNLVRLYRVKDNWKGRGVYYFNHVHTKISQDNDSLKWLKYSPEKTFGFIERFLKNRSSEGAVAFCDHDTDKAYDEVKGLDQKRLSPLRGIEWGGATHMSLVGIKANWELLDKGRTFEREESVIKSRSSEGFRIVNHPFRKATPMEYQSWLDANGVEVWNTLLEGAPFTLFKIRRSQNRKALAEWSKALKNGKRHTAVAGSDFHFAIPCLRDRTLAYPINYLPIEDKSKVKEALYLGRSSIITRPGGPKLKLTAKFSESRNYEMGDIIQGEGTLEVNLSGDFSDSSAPLGGACYKVINKFYKLFTFWKKRSWEVRFYNQAGEVIGKRSFNPAQYGTSRHLRAQFSIPVTSAKDLVRAEVWQVNSKAKSIDLVAATNPIYINW